MTYSPTGRSGEPPLPVICDCERAEKICELQTRRLKGEPLQYELLRFSHNCRARLGVSQQVKRDRRYFVDPPPFAAGFWERDPFNRAIAADANGPAQKRIARDLAGHVAAVQLQDKLMPCHNAQIIRI